METHYRLVLTVLSRSDAANLINNSDMNLSNYASHYPCKLLHTYSPSRTAALPSPVSLTQTRTLISIVSFLETNVGELVNIYFRRLVSQFSSYQGLVSSFSSLSLEALPYKLTTDSFKPCPMVLFSNDFTMTWLWKVSRSIEKGWGNFIGENGEARHGSFSWIRLDVSQMLTVPCSTPLWLSWMLLKFSFKVESTKNPRIQEYSARQTLEGSEEYIKFPAWRRWLETNWWKACGGTIGQAMILP